MKVTLTSSNESSVFEYDIDDKYVDYSPYLSGMINFKGIDECRISMDDTPITPLYFNIYLTFLQTGIINTNKEDDSLIDVFELMGHENTHEFPFHIWKMKMEDRWIRDNMYRLSLPPYHGLIPISYDKEYMNTLSHFLPEFIISCIKNRELVIAGGAICNAAKGSLSCISDIDVFFTCSLERAKEIVEELYEYKYGRFDAHLRPKNNRDTLWYKDYRRHEEYIGLSEFIHENKSKYPSRNDAIKVYNARYSSLKVQFIARVYQSASEVIHGFDVDSCCVLWDGDSVYATKRGKFALDNKLNVFDPFLASPSYAYRLSKYKLRGFSIYLPQFEEHRFNKKLMYAYILTHRRKDDRDASDALISFIGEDLHSDLKLLSDFKDHASVLMMGYVGYSSPKFKDSDYKCDDPNKHKKIKAALINNDDDEFEKLTKQELKWIIFNPMSQVTSTRYPTPIGNLEEWYLQSPFYN